ncbi:hypothetical protein Gorai_006052, partial [Gossypium raimondii]|nr:hypothetical protein [Gossypium raimondii]
MVNKRISPNVYTLNTIISALCKDGKIQEAIFEKRTEEAITMLELMSQRGVKPDIVTYNCLIRGLCNSDICAEATSLFSRMLNGGVQ